VYQLVYQLRQDFEAGAAGKCDTCKALGLPPSQLRTRRSGVRISQGAPLTNHFLSDWLRMRPLFVFELMPSSRDDLAPILARVPTGLLAFGSKPFPVVQGVDEELPIVSAIAKAKI